MATIELRNVRKSYDKHEVIHGVNASIADGEFIVIVGPSGCGKSTLLRMVAGLEDISAGEIAIGGRVVNQIEPAHRDIAMVFQNYALYPHMSVFENMAYGLKIRGTPKAEIRRRVDEAAAILELGALLERRPGQLSGGQRQRVAMGRAIVRHPKAFLFDEPLSNLDAKLRVQMRLEIQKLHQRLQTTSLFVTHDQVEAMTLAQRMIVMNAGQVEQIGTPTEVYARPASAFVAGFIGSPPMNLLQARVSAPGQLTLGQKADGHTEISLPCPQELPPQFTLGIRPEHLIPCAAGAAQLYARVQIIEHLGADSQAYCLLGEQEIVVRLPGHFQAATDSLLPLSMSPDSMHFFDSSTGKRLGD